MIGGITIAGLVAGADTGVIIGAFAGAVIMSCRQLIFQSGIVWCRSGIVQIGTLAAGFVTDAINSLNPDAIHAERPWVLKLLLLWRFASSCTSASSRKIREKVKRLRGGGGDGPVKLS